MHLNQVAGNLKARKATAQRPATNKAAQRRYKRIASFVNSIPMKRGFRPGASLELDWDECGLSV